MDSFGPSTGLPTFPLKTSPPTRDTHLSWAKNVMSKTAKKGNIGTPDPGPRRARRNALENKSVSARFRAAGTWPGSVCLGNGARGKAKGSHPAKPLKKNGNTPLWGWGWGVRVAGVRVGWGGGGLGWLGGWVGGWVVGWLRDVSHTKGSI